MAAELQFTGWQDPAVVMETGLCVWRSGPQPILEAKYNPDWLRGLMALRWSGCHHDTEALATKIRDYELINLAGQGAAVAARKRDVFDLAGSIKVSAQAQQQEGMPCVFDCDKHNALAAKYCGSGWGGYVLYLFASPVLRNLFVAQNVNALAVEPYLRSVQSSVLLYK